MLTLLAHRRKLCECVVFVKILLAALRLRKVFCFLLLITIKFMINITVDQFKPNRYMYFETPKIRKRNRNRIDVLEMGIRGKW